MLLTTTELAARLGVDATALAASLTAYLSTAEASVAAYLGAETLEARDVTARTRLTRDRRTVEVSDGPIGEVYTVTADNASVNLDDVQVSPWAVGTDDGFLAGARVVIEYTAGWTADTVDANGQVTKGNAPASVREAILTTAAAIHANPAGKFSRSVDGVTVDVFNRGDQGGAPALGDLPTGVRAMLRRYARPELS